MRTNVTIDSRLIRTVQKAAGVETKARAVVIALTDYLRWNRVGRISRYRGKLRFRADTARIRHHER